MNINTEDLILRCVPGGTSCDPQTVADNIREYLKPTTVEMRYIYEFSVDRKQIARMNILCPLSDNDVALMKVLIGNVESAHIGRVSVKQEQCLISE